MGYQFFNGSWKKNASRQRINESSTNDDEETDEQLYNIEIGTTAIKCLVLEAKVQEDIERESRSLKTLLAPAFSTAPAPHVITSLATTFADASTSAPSVFQNFIEQQMRLLSQSLTGSIGSMFDKLNQTIDSRLQHISSEISQLQTRMDAYDSTRLAP